MDDPLGVFTSTNLEDDTIFVLIPILMDDPLGVRIQFNVLKICAVLIPILMDDPLGDNFRKL